MVMRLVKVPPTVFLTKEESTAIPSEFLDNSKHLPTFCLSTSYSVSLVVTYKQSNRISKNSVFAWTLFHLLFQVLLCVFSDFRVLDSLLAKPRSIEHVDKGT